jgi:Fe-S cluster assembly protein SufD
MSALAALQPNNLPTPVQEEWKYTNLPRAVPSGLSVLQPEPQTIHRNRGQNGGEAVQLLWTGRDGTLQAPVLKIILDEGAEATIIETHDGNGAYWKNMTTEIILGANAKLNHIRIQNDAIEAVHTNMVRITLERDGTYNGFALNVGGKMMRHEIHAVLNGPNVECSFNGLNLAHGTQHTDTTILMEHKAPHCRSNQFYRTVLDDSARGVFQGKVHVHKPAQKTDGYQLSYAILLSDKAEMDTKPELEIYADDVKCSHGATTGQLDEEPIFYLRSRGLTDAQARLLLMDAFVDEVVDKIEDESVREMIQQKAQGWLHKALSK